MDLQDLQRVDRRTWHRYLFYMDLAVIAIFVISLVVSIRHAFFAGSWYERGEIVLAGQNLWFLIGDVVFLTASLAWIFYRFFRNQYIVLTRRF